MWHHGHRFESVCIYPDRPGVGRVECGSVLNELPPQDLWANDETAAAEAAEKIRREVEWTLAGPIAEARYVNEPIDSALGFFDDVYEAIGLLAHLKQAELGRTRLIEGEIKEVYRHLALARSSVERLFSERAVWRAVEALAAALVARSYLAGCQARQIIRMEEGFAGG